MKKIIFIIAFCLGDFLYAASASWTGLSLSGGGGPSIWNVGFYCFYGDVHSEKGGHGSLMTNLYGHEENGSFYLKVDDLSHELSPTVNAWVLTVYGDVLSDETFQDFMRIAFVKNNDFAEGGTFVTDRTDFYLGVMIPEQGIDDPQNWYGWVHVSIDQDLYMSVLAYDFNLDGGPISVGGSLSTPEPSGVHLLIVGVGLLMLRRTRISRTGYDDMAG